MTKEEFDELRRSAFAIAYRMLGSVSEAEDLVQEGFLHLHRARESGERIESPARLPVHGGLAALLDHLRAARIRGETYHGGGRERADRGRRAAAVAAALVLVESELRVPAGTGEATGVR